MPATDIRYAVGQCSLGALLVARSPAGLCAISLGDDAGALATSLLAAHPAPAPMAPPETTTLLLSLVLT